MKWKDVKLATLQKLFSADTSDIVIDDTTTPYLSAMPNAANTCLNYLATTARHITKKYEIEQDGTETGYKRYDLKSLIADYYSLQPDEIYFQNDDTYGKATNYVMENTWTIYYDAYPQEITEETSDDYEFPLVPEVVNLMPSYMAGQLYKEDDIATSTIYMNEFSAMLNDIKANKPTKSSGEFIDTKGWWS
jgi:alpha-L-fucosidase